MSFLRNWKLIRVINSKAFQELKLVLQNYLKYGFMQ
jgi:hypothetical protein